MTDDERSDSGYPSQRERLRHVGPLDVRLAAEFLLVTAGVFVVFHLLVLPGLRTVAPEAFAASIADTDGRKFPATTTGQARLLLLTVVGGAFVYVRLFYTDLGDRLREKYARLYGLDE